MLDCKNRKMSEKRGGKRKLGNDPSAPKNLGDKLLNAESVMPLELHMIYFCGSLV